MILQVDDDMFHRQEMANGKEFLWGFSSREESSEVKENSYGNTRPE
jgi:hypothetical protein